jgi:hypothetical protein
MGAATNALWQLNPGYRPIAEAQGVKDLAVAHVVHHIHGERNDIAIVFTA